MLAKNWQSHLPVADFLVSEKLDGVRALWDGQTLRFRSGHAMATPAWFTERLPRVALDGELWIARRRFDAVSATVRRSEAVDAQWQAVRYMVFDAPSSEGPFVQRVAALAALVAQTKLPWLEAIAQTRVANAAELAQRLRETVDAGGEGLVLHRAQALWHAGRSDDVRKLKPSPDEEGRVLAHIPGKGQYQGRMGALLLETPEGLRFALGSGFTQAQREAPPPVGSMVTYRFHDRTEKGLPKFASFLRVREEP